MTHVRARAGVAVAYGLLCVVWSTTWISIKIGLHGAPPLIGVGLRSLLAGACFAAFALGTGRSLCPPRDRWGFIGITAFCVFTVPYATVYLTETQITSGLTAVLAASLPIFSTLVAHRLLPDEPLTRRGLAGVVVGVAGVAIVFRGGLQLSATPLAIAGAASILVGQAFLALGQAFGRRESGTIATPVLLAWSMLVAAAFLLVTGLAVGPRRLALDERTLGSIAYLALAGSVLGFALLYWLLARLTAVSVSLMMLVLPVLALLEGWAFYDEPLNASLVLGSTVVVAGIALAARSGARPNEPAGARIESS